MYSSLSEFESVAIRQTKLWGIAKNSTLKIPLFISTLTNFTIKILIGKVPLYSYLIKPKTNSSLLHLTIILNLIISDSNRRWRIMAATSSPARSDDAAELSGEIRRSYGEIRRSYCKIRRSYSEIRQRRGVKTYKSTKT